MPPAQALLYTHRALQVRSVCSLFSITQEVEHPLISSANTTLPTPVVRVRSRSLLSTVTRMNPLNSSATRTTAIRTQYNSPPGEREVPVKGHPSPVGSIQPSALPLYSLLCCYIQYLSPLRDLLDRHGNAMSSVMGSDPKPEQERSKNVPRPGKHKTTGFIV